MRSSYVFTQVAAIAVTALLAMFSQRSIADDDFASPPPTDTRYSDALDQAIRMAGVGDPVGDGHSVDLFNGNLLIQTQDTPSFPLDGGFSFSLGRAYNSKNARYDRVYDGWLHQDRLYGRSWCGFGWTCHLGRITTVRAWDSGDYKNSERALELPSGRLYRFFPNQKSASPNLIITHYPDCHHTDLPPAPPDSWPCCAGGRCDPASEECRGPAPNACDDRQSDPDEHYIVTDERGTRYRYEQIVEESPPAQSGWVENADRAGFYVVSWTDTSGNNIRVRYWQRSCLAGDNPPAGGWPTDCAQAYPYPEAIRDIGRAPANPADAPVSPYIEVSLYGAGPFAGLMSEIRATGFEGKTIRATLDYEIKSLRDGQATAAVPYLRHSVVLHDGQPYLTTTYGEDSSTPPLVASVTFPLGASVQYTYGAWTSGKRGIATRQAYGVVQRTVLPEGIGAGKPQASWTWARNPDVTSAGRTCDAVTPWYLSNYEVIAPDERRVRVAYFGHPCGLASPIWGPWRTEAQMESIGGAGQAPIRTSKYTIFFQQDYWTGEIVRVTRESVTTAFHDGAASNFVAAQNTANWRGWDDSTCPKVVRTEYGTRDAWSRWPKRKITGSYIKNDRIEYTAFVPRAANGVLGPWRWRSIEDVTLQQVQEAATFDSNGRLTKLTKVARTLPQSADNTPTEATPAATDPSVEFQYDARGNLEEQGTSGSDTTGLPQSRTHFTSASGVTASVELWDEAAGTMLFRPIARQIDASGLSSTETDTNGFMVDYDYDDMNRPTAQAWQNSTESGTSISYPDKYTVRTQRGADGDAVWSRVVVDKMGRLVEEFRPDPSNTYTETKRVRAYDMLGRVVFVSSWFGISEPVTQTVWENASQTYSVSIPYKGALPYGTVIFYGTIANSDKNPLLVTPDPLGRVRARWSNDGTPEGHWDWLRYWGPHEEATREGVVTSTDGTRTSSVQRRYVDGLGRTAVLDAPTGEANIVYNYNARDQVTQIQRVDDDALGSDPFQSWLTGSITGGQISTTEYDGAGRVLSATTPERGTIEYGIEIDGSAHRSAYDSAGHAITWTDEVAREKNYYFRAEYDAAGRLVSTSRETRNNLPLSDYPPNGSFENGSVSWEEGVLTGDSFSPMDTAWTVGPYSAGCVVAPPGVQPNQLVLHWGAVCGYPSATAGKEAIRIHLGTILSDATLSFDIWREVREGENSKDKFSVILADSGRGSDLVMENQRTLYTVDDRQDSLASWQHTIGMPLRELVGRQGNWWLLLVFDKGDGQPGTGRGLFVDNVSIRRVSSEPLLEMAYDEALCADGSVSTDACAASGATSEYPTGKVTSVYAYQDGVLATSRRYVYQGLTGRVSAMDEAVNWTLSHPGGVTPHFVSTAAYNNSGDVRLVESPHLPGEPARAYEYVWARGLLQKIDDPATLEVFLDQISYDNRGLVDSMRAGNGVTTTIARDALGRVGGLEVSAPSEEAPIWATGLYAYDGVGNIAAIGDQRFAYNVAGAITAAQVRPVLKAPSQTALDSVTWQYNIFGNVTAQTWSGQGTPPADFAFTGRAYDDATNRIMDRNLAVYDANGNVTTTKGPGQIPLTFVWSGTNQMSATYSGDPALTDIQIVEQYLYDDAGQRTVRFPFRDTPQEVRRGRPLLTLRSLDGRVTSEYEITPGQSVPELRNEILAGIQSVLVERHPVAEPLAVQTVAPLVDNGKFRLSVGAAGASAALSVDTRTTAGVSERVSVDGGPDGAFELDESGLTPNDSNFIRAKVEGANESDWSAPVAIAFRTIAYGAANQVRAVSVSRASGNLTVRWVLQAENNKPFRVYFRRADTSTLVLLTPTWLSSGTRSLIVPSQALVSGCGAIFLRQQAGGGESGDSVSVNVPTTVTGPPRAETACDAAAGGSPTLFAEVYHHRDHLGSLRLATDDTGLVVQGSQVDYYPFGQEMVPEGTGIARTSTRKFTGHERDEVTGLDYMIARYKPAFGMAFLSPDPIRADLNAYRYVANSPLNATDPLGLMINPIPGCGSDVEFGFPCVDGGSWFGPSGWIVPDDWVEGGGGPPRTNYPTTLHPGILMPFEQPQRGYLGVPRLSSLEAIGLIGPTFCMTR